MPKTLKKAVQSKRDKYDWDFIFDGTPRRYSRGTDFTCTANSFLVYVYRKARELGIKVRCIQVDDASVDVHASV